MPEGISILIVSYHHPKYLANAVYSILKNPPNIPIEILCLENGDDLKDKALFYELLKEVNLDMDERILYFTGYGGLGLGDGMNFLGTKAKYDHILAVCEDMFFCNNGVQLLYNALKENPKFGIACGYLFNNDGTYERHNPSLENVNDWYRRYPNENINLIAFSQESNFPFLMKKELWNELSELDNWIDSPPMPFNRYKGPFDNSIDPQTQWAGDWYLFNKIRFLGYLPRIILQCCVFHFDHVSCDLQYGKGNSIWQQLPVIRYISKFGRFEKHLPFRKIPMPLGYPW